MLKTQTKIKNIEKQRLIKAIEARNYNNPWSDPDGRQEKIFEHILSLLDKGYTWRFDTSMGLESLAKNSASTEYIFGVLQPRNEKSGDKEGVSQYSHEFYILQRRLHRVIVMAEVESNLYTLAGGKRTAAHIEGMKQGFQSRCDAVVLVPPSDIPLSEALRDLKYISDVSNADSEDKTRPMDMASYANSLRSQWDLDCQDPAHWASENVQNISETKIRKWAKAFLKDIYSYEPVDSTFSNIFNQVFSPDRGQVWETSKDEIKKLWSDNFPNQDWVEEPTNGQYCQMVAYTRLKRSPFPPLNNEWFKRDSFSPTRDEVGIVLTLESITDSIETVLDQKAQALTWLSEYNRNANYAQSGASLVTRVLMPSHINHPADLLTAVEWVKSKQEFCPVKA